MFDAIGLVIMGVLMLIFAPFGHYHRSWRTPWDFAGWGLLVVVLGLIGFLVEAWSLAGG